MQLITNSNKKNDRLRLYLNQYGKNSDIKIASAFFSDSKTVKKFTEQNCDVKLIIRLGRGTSSKRLKEIIGLNNVFIRFFNGNHFHPKFYLFDRNTLILGSGNFTNNGVYYNPEALILINAEENQEIIDETNQLFSDYWEQAKPLTIDELKKFELAEKEFEAQKDDKIEMKRAMGELVEFNNRGIDKDKKTTLEKNIEAFSKNYHVFLKNYDELINTYLNYGYRKYPNLPIRIETDRFLWWVREEPAKGDNLAKSVKLKPSDRQIKIEANIKDYSTSKIVFPMDSLKDPYLAIKKAFNSQADIEKMSSKEIAKILSESVNAFYSSFRYSGGLLQLRELFATENSEEKIKNILSYLLFGKDKYDIRLANCINNPKYKLKHFGENSITELFGLVNNDNIPMKNQRVMKSLKFLGFSD